MDAGKRDITAIFNQARTLQIPFFQRAYVWKRDDWERFADDMIVDASRKGYFLGSIILKQKETSSADVGDVRIVVDGQQRLTSLVLFFRVLCDVHANPGLFDRIFLNLKNELVLQHNHNDLEVFESVAAGTGLTGDQEKKYSHNRVLGAFNYFRSRGSELGQLDPMAIVRNVYFVGIDLGKEEDEQQIFDTINSLGVDLTTAELLKNELYDRDQLDFFNDTWKPVFEDSEATKQYWALPVTAGRSHRQNIDLFLQAFLLNQPGIGDDVRVANLFSDYRLYLKESQVDRKGFAVDLAGSADIYQQCISPERLSEAIDMDDPIERINVVIFGLQTTTVLPYVLHIISAVDSEEERNAMLQVVETYLVRRLIAGETNKHYNKFFAALARGGTSTLSKLVAAFTASDDPSSRLPTDNVFMRGFSATNLTNRQARVVLYLLEGSIRDDSRHSTALAGFEHYTLEHIMPKKWRNNWEWPTTEEEQRERDGRLLKLGNLTLLSAALNSSVRDSDWQRKKLGTDGHGGLQKFGRGLDIFDTDLGLEQWGDAEIENRGKRLAASAIQVGRIRSRRKRLISETLDCSVPARCSEAMLVRGAVDTPAAAQTGGAHRRFDNGGSGAKVMRRLNVQFSQIEECIPDVPLRAPHASAQPAAPEG